MSEPMKPEPLTDEELAATSQRHSRTGDGKCGWCENSLGFSITWPCLTARLLTTLDAAQKEVARLINVNKACYLGRQLDVTQLQEQIRVLTEERDVAKADAWESRSYQTDNESLRAENERLKQTDKQAS